LKKFINLITVVFPISFLLTISVQEKTFAQIYEIGGGIGVSSYTGDIIRIGDPQQLGLQGTFFGRRNFDNVWSFRGGLSFATLKAADANRPIDAAHLNRDAFFSGSLLEVSGIMEYHFLDYLHPYSEFRYSPYGFFGLGYMMFSGNGKTYLFDLTDLDYGTSSIVLPLGVGVKYKLNDQWILAMELGYRATMTDRIDKIDKNAVPHRKDPAFIDPSLNPYTMNGGNVHDKDGYYFLGLTLSYTFKTLKCLTY